MNPTTQTLKPEPGLKRENLRHDENDSFTDGPPSDRSRSVYSAALQRSLDASYEEKVLTADGVAEAFEHGASVIEKWRAARA